MIGIVLKGYPRLSETFIAQELAGLEARGLRYRIISLRHPTDSQVHPVHKRIRAQVDYLPEYLYEEPMRVLRAWADVCRWPTYPDVRKLWARDLMRDRTPNRGRRFGQALVLASELRGKVDRLYAHFLHTPASVARYAAMLLEVPWAVSAHAKDVWTIPDWEKREKLESCEWLVTCTKTNESHLKPFASQPDKVSLVYHGLDLTEFPPQLPPRAPKSSKTLEILSVGRTVEKKGYDDLLVALSRLPDDLTWRFRHIGEGKLTKKLERQAARLGLEKKIDWCGARPKPEVLSAMRRCDIFVLASRVALNGDRDGLPNVLMEAFSQGVPCVATNVAAIPELIDDEVNGLLVTAGDVNSLADGIERLLRSSVLRRELGKSALERINADFGHEIGLEILCEKLSSL